MTILIRGMEMPEGCRDCELGGQYLAEQNGVYTEEKYRCFVTFYPLKDLTKRHEKCPLTEVPTPHGRLIDADAVEKLVEGYQEQADIHSGRAKELCGDSDTVSKFTWAYSQAAIYKRVIDDLDTVLSSAPTVIEAEEVEE